MDTKLPIHAPFGLFKTEPILVLSKNEIVSPEYLSAMAQLGDKEGYYLIVEFRRQDGSVYRPFNYMQRPNYWNAMFGTPMAVWRNVQDAAAIHLGIRNDIIANSEKAEKEEQGSDRWDQVYGNTRNTIESVLFHKIISAKTAEERARERDKNKEKRNKKKLEKGKQLH